MRRLPCFVAKYMGDGVLVYFGYPQAHEDDAERADTKKPKTLAEAEHMLDRISVMADETILDEDAAKSSLAKGLISKPFFP